MKLKHWLIFILLNIIISAATTLSLLMYWDRAHPWRSPEPMAMVAATATSIALTPTSPVTPAPTLPVRPESTATPFYSRSTVYIVQRGDTLSAISRRFGVTVQDLLRANNLTIDSVLQVGQQIIIPNVGAIPVTETPSASPTPLPSELVQPVTATPIEIRQVIARGDPAREAVVIANLGRQVNLRGWRLSDAEGNVYTFPDLTLWSGGTITVHTGSGPDSVSDLYWKRNAPVWAEPGDVVTLTDATSNVVARYQLP